LLQKILLMPDEEWCSVKTIQGGFDEAWRDCRTIFECGLTRKMPF
jgi:hypothetical protein